MNRTRGLTFIAALAFFAATVAVAGGPNELEIVIHPNKFEWRPQIPTVIPSQEPFVVVVDWSQNKGKWLSVTVHDFKDESGNIVQPVSSITVEAGDSSPKELLLPDVSEEVVLKYDIVFERAKPKESFTLDPTVILRPGDWVPATQD